MNNKDKLKLFKELKGKIESSIGMKIVIHNRQLTIISQIFLGNYTELKNSLDLLSNQDFALDLWGVEKRDELEHYQINIVRLLHNYLASAMTLVDNTRNFINSLNYDTHLDAQFRTEYEEKVKIIFASSGLSKFVHDLRNYILHNGLPVISNQLRFNKQDNLACSMILDINKMKSWKRWTRESKKYIDILNPEIKLEEIVSEYSHIVLDFYKWFGERQNEIYQIHLKELNDIQEELKKIMIDIFPMAAKDA